MKETKCPDGKNVQVAKMFRWQRCLLEQTRTGTGSWTRRSGIGFSTLPAAELPCEINLMKINCEINLMKIISKTISRFRFII